MVLVVACAACATRRSPAPVVERSAKPKAVAARPLAAPPAPASVPQSPDYYIVKRGDTLYSIALDSGADYREVAQWNHLEDPTKIQVGQQLRVTPPPGQAQVSAARGVGPVESRPLGGEPARRAEAPKPAPPVAAGPGLFGWPAKGRILAEFAEPRKKGIDIDGKPGDPVLAAASGRVTYVGTGIQGMGKLVVIKHDNGYITVYAHNQDVVVKEQQAVARGQKIAEIGSTDAERPKLHFQIRKGAAPVDPLLYLPKT
ncbi:MAG TPA: peptidoglycan DD-metalloendopeptidase family protein [Burkholderiales bacterium]|nr:peptidoglycan DD-metalloendopeptidase family protein [Burkholderiales bacterium]